MRWIRWRYILPPVNAVLASALTRIAIQQRADYLAKTNAVEVWDYVPPAAQIAHMINFPAFFAWSVVHHLRQLGKLEETVGYLLFVMVLWYLVGFWADNRTASVPRKQSRLSFDIVRYVCGTVLFLAVGAFGVANLMLHPILGLAGLLWCAFLLWSVASALRRRIKVRSTHLSSEVGEDQTPARDRGRGTRHAH